MTPGKPLGVAQFRSVIKRLHTPLEPEKQNMFNRLLHEPLSNKLYLRLYRKLYNGIAMRGAPLGYRL